MNFYRRFIKVFLKKTELMSFLLKEDKTEKISISFIWMKKAEKMFT